MCSSDLSDVDPAAEGLRLATTTQEAPTEIVLVNSFASGGALVSAVLHVPRAS